MGFTNGIIEKKKKNDKIIIFIGLLLGFVCCWLLIKFIYIEVEFKKGETKLLDAAKKYYEYDESYLPKENFEIKEVTLGKLRDKSLIEDILFSTDNDKCDSDNSFVRVAMIDGEYVYKTYLDCENKKSKTSLLAKEIVLIDEVTTIIVGDEYIPNDISNEKDFYMDSLNIDYTFLDINTLGDYQVIYSVLDKNMNISEKTINISVVSTLGTEMAKNDFQDGYLVGKTSPSYVRYSGFLWFVYGVNEDGTLKAAMLSNAKSIGLGDAAGDYIGSGLDVWLNDDFYSLLYQPEKYIDLEANWCIYSSDNYDEYHVCVNDDYYVASVGTMNANDMIKTYDYSILDREYASKFRMESPLHIMTRGNEVNNSTYYLMQEFFTQSSEFIAEVKPVINFNPDNLVSGSGISIDPYVFLDESYDNEDKNNVSDISIGSVVDLGNRLWIVSGKDDTSLDLITYHYLYDSNDEYITFDNYNNISEAEMSIEGGVLHYLNNEFIDSLDTSRIVSRKYEYNTLLNYDDMNYNTSLTENEYKVFLPTYQDFFNGGALYTDYYTYSFIYMNEYIDDIYTSYIRLLYGYMEINPFTIEKPIQSLVRPKITISNEGKILDGNGSGVNPYKIN